MTTEGDDDDKGVDVVREAIVRLARHPREVAGVCLRSVGDNAIDFLAIAPDDVLAEAVSDLLDGVDFDLTARALGFLAGLVVTLRQAKRYAALQVGPDNAPVKPANSQA